MLELEAMIAGALEVLEAEGAAEALNVARHGHQQQWKKRRWRNGRGWTGL